MTEILDGVAVIGAGPVGLVTALTLAQAGVPVTVFERAVEIDPSPRALVYQIPTVEALDRLGVLADMRAIGVFKQDTEWRSLDGDRLGRQDLATLGPQDTRFPFHLHLGQDRLAAVVLAHLLRLPGADVRWNHKLAGLSQDEAAATLHFETADGPRAVRARWVIGADGAASTVRSQLKLPFEGQTWPEWFVATDVDCDFGTFGYPKATFIVDPEHWAVIVQINAEGRYRVTYGEPEGTPREALRDRVAAKYAALLPDRRPREPLAVSPYRVHDRCATRFRVNRVLLAGDAAHANNPIGGLGLTNGLLDGVALGEALGMVVKCDRTPDILDRYAQERRRIFLELVSPSARENKRRLSEADPARQRADAERLRQLTCDPQFARNTLLFTHRLVSRPTEW